ncbi:IS200/IS605 family transposase, partial [Alkalibacterium sp. MB6]|uniref:IS200/IS605 family transposase n=1 Tax=Alkalibacterium sp. MB6 TaxID=2081965 RepID=UPI00137B21A8
KALKGRGYVYYIQYHIVWCVKYRKPIIKGSVEIDLKEIISSIANDNEITILEMETDKDHIHLLVECKPQHYIPSIMKALKGTSARRLFQKYPELKESLYGGHLWNPTYFVATVSDNTEDQIKHYIQNQQINHK